MEEPLLTWTALGVLALVHAYLTLIENALREVSNARLEEELASSELVERYNTLLQRDADFLERIAVIQGCGMLAMGGLLAFIATQPQHSDGHLLRAMTIASVLGLGLVLFGKTIPRTFGDRFAERVVIRTLPTLSGLLWAFAPLTRPFGWCRKIALRVAGSPEEEDAVEEADDEILSAALEAVRDGVLEESAAQMIEKVIDFRDAEVTEIMTPRIDIIGVEAGATAREAMTIMAKNGLSRLPIYEDSVDKIVAMVHLKDLIEPLNQLDQEPSPSLADIARKPLFIPESKRVRDLFGDIKRDKVHVAVVVDEYGGTAGLVTMGDIVSEIFGDVADEHDTESHRESIEQLKDGAYSIDGKVHIDELNENLGFTIPEDDDYETIGGYLTASLGRIPTIGEQHRHEALLFRVIEGDERKVDRVVIERQPV